MTAVRVAIICAAILALGVAGAFAAPQLNMPDTLYDFGYVPQNAHISHVFWLKSTGTDSLKIIKVTPGCGCTQAPIDKSELAPKDSTRLEIIFNTGNYNGQVLKEPRLTTNDAVSERMIYFRANVVTRPDSTYPIVIAPYKLDISQFGEKQRGEIRFTIKNESNGPLSPTVAASASDFFSVDLPKSIEPGKSAEGMIKLTKDALGKEFEKSFTIQLNDERQSRFTVPVKRSIHTMTSAATSPAPATAGSAH